MIAWKEVGAGAGCTLFAGYPITPSTEIAERLAQRLPRLVLGIIRRRVVLRG